MTEVDCSLEILLDARARLRRELPQRLSTAHKQFLSGLVRAEPDWSLVQCQHAAQLPALRWKLSNLETFRKRSEEHTSELQSLMRNSSAVFCLKKKKTQRNT